MDTDGVDELALLSYSMGERPFKRYSRASLFLHMRC